MIQFEDVSVTFQSKEKKIDAVKNVSFSINDGDICGIVGTSGAGKSTLLRTINQLQKPTEGNVLVDGEDISKLDGKELRKARLGIGMIFQQFNLIGSKTISENIAFAMEVAGKSEKEIKKRVPELLKLVGLTDRANSYPSQLSGGQKQRVGIARGVANNPRILLCDEPTSALDPETTNAILVLLKEINQKIGITIVIITHELDVVKKICNKVAVMSKGKLVEYGETFRVFTSPREDFTKKLADQAFNLELPDHMQQKKDEPLLKIIYNGSNAESAVISSAIKRFGITINILHGKIEYITNHPFGMLIIQLIGKEEDIEKTIEYLKENTYKIELLN